MSLNDVIRCNSAAGTKHMAHVLESLQSYKLNLHRPLWASYTSHTTTPFFMRDFIPSVTMETGGQENMLCKQHALHCACAPCRGRRVQLHRMEQWREGIERGSRLPGTWLKDACECNKINSTHNCMGKVNCIWWPIASVVIPTSKLHEKCVTITWLSHDYYIPV